MTIVIDMDNVLCNLQEVVVNLFNKRYGKKYTLEDFTDYDVSQILPKNEAVLMKSMYCDDNIYNSVKPLHGAQNVVEKLINAGHNVYIVSDIIPKTYVKKVEWLNFYFPQIDEAHIVAMKHKHRFKCDVMIEDNMQNLLASPYYERICFDYAWNRKVSDYAYNIHRVSNWNEVLGVINKLDLE